MAQAVGLIEVYGLVAAFAACDAGCKAADVTVEPFDKNKPKNPAKSMDLHNNSVGYSLGIKAIENEWSDEELLKNVIKAADDGILQIGL